jgi:hypothetical protein
MAGCAVRSLAAVRRVHWCPPEIFSLYLEYNANFSSNTPYLHSASAMRSTGS